MKRAITILAVGLGAVFLHKEPRGVAYPAHALDHVNRHADRAALVGDCPGDCLPYPPGTVGAEFKTATVVKFINSSC